MLKLDSQLPKKSLFPSMIALRKWWKMPFISSSMLFSSWFFGHVEKTALLERKG